MTEASADRSRVISDTPGPRLSGFVGGDGERAWEGRRVGGFRDAEQAQAWLKGEGDLDYKDSRPNQVEFFEAAFRA